MTITRVGTNEKYSDGWNGIFGGKAYKKVANEGPVTTQKAVKKNAAKSAVPATKKLVEAKKTAPKVTATKAAPKAAKKAVAAKPAPAKTAAKPVAAKPAVKKTAKKK